ncbi:hypothetical protein B0H13DRAFT_1904925 [Mycena leptocephala]|nr:hypothetical protein B0H13DRAFT_1904925 [Mycena leptocephala]
MKIQQTNSRRNEMSRRAGYWWTRWIYPDLDDAESARWRGSREEISAGTSSRSSTLWRRVKKEWETRRKKKASGADDHSHRRRRRQAPRLAREARRQPATRRVYACVIGGADTGGVYDFDSMRSGDISTPASYTSPLFRTCRTTKTPPPALFSPSPSPSPFDLPFFLGCLRSPQPSSSKRLGAGFLGARPQRYEILKGKVGVELRRITASRGLAPRVVPPDGDVQRFERKRLHELRACPSSASSGSSSASLPLFALAGPPLPPSSCRVQRALSFLHSVLSVIILLTRLAAARSTASFSRHTHFSLYTCTWPHHSCIVGLHGAGAAGGCAGAIVSAGLGAVHVQRVWPGTGGARLNESVLRVSWMCSWGGSIRRGRWGGWRRAPMQPLRIPNEESVRCPISAHPIRIILPWDVLYHPGTIGAGLRSRASSMPQTESNNTFTSLQELLDMVYKLYRAT